MAHSVGKTIATLRKEKGWTQADLAEKIGLTDKAVSKWESEGGLPDTTIFPTLAKIFGVSIDYLMTGPKENKKREQVCQANPSNNVSVADQEKKIEEALQDGIISVEKILATKDFQIIKKAITEYPIHPFELDYAQITKLYEAIEQQKWKELFIYAVDNEYIRDAFEKRKMAIAIINNDSDTVKKYLSEIEKNFIGKWNSSYDRYSNSPRYSSINHIELRGKSANQQYGSKSILDYINRYKQQVIEDASLKYDKEKIIENLTKEYFENEFDKGNIEIVIIKLCVRLEAILKSDYHYEGELADMMKRYCDEHGSEDDGWGYSQKSEFVDYLHKLRKQRNSIVHSEKTNEQMTEEEIKFCIDYICQLG